MRMTDEIAQVMSSTARPLHAPAGTPFLATICGGLPQLVVRTHHQGDLEAWWMLDGPDWQRCDDMDVTLIARLQPAPLGEVLTDDA